MRLPSGDAGRPVPERRRPHLRRGPHRAAQATAFALRPAGEWAVDPDGRMDERSAAV